MPTPVVNVLHVTQVSNLARSPLVCLFVFCFVLFLLFFFLFVCLFVCFCLRGLTNKHISYYRWREVSAVRVKPNTILASQGFSVRIENPWLARMA
jgi:hypothetical protein